MVRKLKLEGGNGPEDPPRLRRDNAGDFVIKGPYHGNSGESRYETYSSSAGANTNASEIEGPYINPNLQRKRVHEPYGDGKRLIDYSEEELKNSPRLKRKSDYLNNGQFDEDLGAGDRGYELGYRRAFSEYYGSDNPMTEINEASQPHSSSSVEGEETWYSNPDEAVGIGRAIQENPFSSLAVSYLQGKSEARNRIEKNAKQLKTEKDSAKKSGAKPVPVDNTLIPRRMNPSTPGSPRITRPQVKNTLR